MSVENNSTIEQSRNIPNGWVETTLGTLVKVGRGSSPRPIHNYLSDKGIPWVKIADATASNNKYIEKTKQFILEEGRSTSVKPGDLIVSNSATPGIPKIMAINACVHDGWLVFGDYSNIDKLFLYYFFLFFRRKLNYSASGSVFKNLKTDIVRNINILLPKSIKEQTAIAKILTAFDDKIELLQAQNKTLETTAQSIFKEWFGKYQIGDLSACSAQADELPDGWRVGKLSEIADFLNGLALQKYPPIAGEETLPVIKIRELKQGITSNTDKANTHLDEKYIIQNGDILFSWSGSLEVVIWQNGKGALNQHLFKVSSQEFPKWFYYFWIINHLRDFKGVAANKATTMGHINRKHLDLAQVIIPNEVSFKKYNQTFNPLIEKLENNHQQIQTLKQTRDTLLPKLMSGTLRVKQ